MKIKQFIIACILTAIIFPVELRSQFNLVQNADIQATQSNFQEARKMLTDHINMNPFDAEAFVKRAHINGILGLNKEKEMDFSVAEFINPYAKMYVSAVSRSKHMAKKKYNYNWMLGQEEFIKSPVQFKYYRQYINDLELDETQDSMIKMAINSLEQGNIYEAEIIAESLVENKKNKAVLFDIKGLINMKNGDIDTAIDFFTKSIQFMPEFPMPYHHRSICYKLNKDYDKAQNDLYNAIALDDEISLFYFTAAKLNEYKNNEAQALDYYTVALELNNNYSEARTNYALLLKSHGHYDHSLVQLSSAINNQPLKTDNYFLRGSLHLTYGEYQEAINDFEIYLLDHSNDADALYNKGLAHILSGDKRLGCEYMTQSLEQSPNEKRLMILNSFCSVIY